MSELPTGTVTFYFSDIEGSTRLIQQLGDRYPDVLLAHHTIQRQALAANGGHELRTEGDSFFIVFDSALKACAGAAAVQQSLQQHSWPDGGQVRVRIGLHTGEATLVGDEYLGLDVHRAARVASAGHGGQVLVSETTRALVDQVLPPGLTLKDLGMHRLKDLARAERLFQLTIDGVPSDFPPLKTVEATPNNLPTQLTSFIGRDDQLREAKDLLARSRLLTLTGPGGTGKTRLSLEIAADLLDQFSDGVYFVPLSAVHDPELVASAIAQALAISTTGSRRPIDALLEHLREKRTLLVLDNFEQVLKAAPIATQLLEGSPGLRVLVSSRAVLHVSGEQEFPVPPLALPDLKALPGIAALSQFEAVRLFIERAVAVKPDFRATNENAPAIAGICERVDGLPLAIELAAARVKLFSPPALLSRLEKSLSALGSGARDAPARQQTLRGAILWSYDMLDAGARRLLARVSVFARGGSLEQLEPVCGPAEDVGGDVVEALDQLADQSLLRRLPDFDAPRFLMLQTIRDFATERLEESGEADVIRDRHLKAFIALAQEAQPHLFGPKRKEWLDRLQEDHDNFRAALEWAVSTGNAQEAMSLGGLFWRFWQMRGHIHEGRTRLEQILSLQNSGEFPTERLAALEAAGGLAYWQADMDGAQRFYDESLALTRQIGDKRAIANAIYNDAFPMLVNRTNIPKAKGLLEEALPLFRELGDNGGVARTLWGLGNAFYFDKEYTTAKPFLEEAQALFRGSDDRFMLAWSTHTLGLVAVGTGNHEIGKRWFSEALKLFVEAKDVSGITLQLDNLSVIARAEGDPVRATRLAAAAVAQQTSTGTGLGGLLSQREGRSGREGLGEKEAATAWAEGQAVTLDEAIAYALDPTALPASLRDG
ncbi:MAG TPA: adenylate/guanylate cyclase domain-containing protein [Candidatus Dormibacteraeota bacterium]|nr:adenylate/guanylate cyclase domain-containing protein [Candidatus Dormibacteraeota bacterium]